MEGIWYGMLSRVRIRAHGMFQSGIQIGMVQKMRLFKRGFQTKREALEYELSFVSENIG